MKVAIIGAGNVGAMLASRVVDTNLADVVLVDIIPGLAKGKALDISDARPIFGSSADIVGTENFSDIADASIVVVTCGIARKPGMSRNDLLETNVGIIKDVSKHIKNFCPHSIVLVVTNPLDITSYVAMKETGFPPKRVMGMAGVLDTARFLNIAKESYYKDIEKDKLFIMGSHGDTMVPINRTDRLDPASFKEIEDATRNRGAEIVENLNTGSAYFAPSASVFYMLKAIIKDEKKTMCVSAYLNGEYGEKDIYIGVPVVLGTSGIEEIVEIELTQEEKETFKRSAIHIREGIRQASNF